MKNSINSLFEEIFFLSKEEFMIENFKYIMGMFIPVVLGAILGTEYSILFVALAVTFFVLRRKIDVAKDILKSFLLMILVIALGIATISALVVLST